jgi:butyrate kinase
MNNSKKDKNGLEKKYILVINPGSTSTKVALFKKQDMIWQETLEHSPEDLKAFERVWHQLSFRARLIENLLLEKQVLPFELAAVAGRGGLLKPVEGGTYLVNERMLEDAEKGVQGEHAANLGCALAHTIAERAGVQAYVVDPISVDEFEPLARYSGHPLITRRSLSHALNIHAVSRLAAEKLGVDYKNSNFIVAHLGGGISVAPVRAGKIIDVNDASSDGPFSPERTGGLPLQPFIRLCFSGEYTEDQMRKLVMGYGGLWAYLATHSAKEVEKRIAEGDAKAKEVYQAMAYQIAKEIGAMATVLQGQVQAIILTGGLAYSKMLLEWIKMRVGFIARVTTFEGENEMQAMNLGVLRVLADQEKAKIYY